jgi:hypothetical protein
MIRFSARATAHSESLGTFSTDGVLAECDTSPGWTGVSYVYLFETVVPGNQILLDQSVADWNANVDAEFGTEATVTLLRSPTLTAPD